MKTYLVGGAVRDELMGLGDSDKDWVVVGATPEDLIFQGFTPVGKDFPVFLHPETSEEYALARTERKTARGYKGFVFHADPSITLEEDLVRRDLTINAIAKDEHGTLIDPFDGNSDIQNKIFRHVSPAFKEDPVRILRLARFAARFPEFTIATETQILLKQMCEEGEVDALVSERVWQEISKGLMAESPYRMFTVLLGCGAFQKLFKNIEPKYLDERHQEALKASIDRFKEVRASLAVRFAVINYIWPIAQTLRVPKECIEMADLLAKTYTTLCNSIQLKGEELLSFLQVCDALRRPDRFDELLLGARCLVLPTHDKEGSKVVLEKLDTSTHHIKHMQKVALSVDHKEIALQAIKQGLVAVQIGEAIDQARLKALEAAMKKL